MFLSARARIGLRIFAGLVLAFLYVPLVDRRPELVQQVADVHVPADRASPEVVEHRGAQRRRASSALWASVQAGLGATAIALVLGTMAAFAVQRYTFFGRSTISFLVVLPIALPGIVTGIALNERSRACSAIDFGICDGHHRSRDVLHRHRVQQRAGPAAAHSAARSRRPRPTSARPAGRPSATSRFPQLRGALLAGALLAFGLSFDEIVVTNFTAPRRGPDPAAVDLQQPVPSEPGAGGERRRGGAHRRRGAAGVDRAEAQRRRGRQAGLRRSNTWTFRSSDC